MTVLVDTLVWVDHFRQPNAWLAELMVLDRVLIHPLVIGELACGTPPHPRLRTLADLELLRPVTAATPQEVREFIEREKLYGLGCGWIDLTLLASTCLTQATKLWTLDNRLASLADRFNASFAAPVDSAH